MCFFITLASQTNNLSIMKNLKKIGRENLKSITGGRLIIPPDCTICGCPVGTKICHYDNENMTGGGCGSIRCGVL